MKKPIIGITLDSEESGQYSKFPWYAIRKNHLFSIEKFGGIPFPLYHSMKSINNIFDLITDESYPITTSEGLSEPYSEEYNK